jgi:tetratricopeptide (TPR) repeat protein
MRGLLITSLVCGAIVLPLESAWAGVYRQSEMAEPLPVRWNGNNSVNLKRGELFMISDQYNTLKPPKKDERRDFREMCLKETESLEKKEQEKGLAPSECLDLSGCYLRLGRFKKAIGLLEKKLGELEKAEPYRFLLQSNLAMAYWEDGFPSRAIQWQRESLSNWPTTFKGWTWEQWHRYRLAEQRLLSLMLHRAPELEGRGASSQALTLDPLFPGVTFNGPGGKYIVGGIALAAADKLPMGAEAILSQLILWMPNDARLLWYYAEVLNAEGKTNDAWFIMDLLRNPEAFKVTTPELRQHWHALVEAGADAPPPQEKEDRPNLPTLSGSGSSTAPPPPLIDWRTLSVGFAAGALVAILTVLQVQEWRRRRAAPRG